MAYHTETPDRFPAAYLAGLVSRIRQHPLLAPNNLTSDFVGARGFSIVFRQGTADRVGDRYPWLAPFIAPLLSEDVNAFYLNPLVIGPGGRVDPHIDRSLRAYCRTVEPPRWVSVLYVDLPRPMSGGELVLRAGKRQVARIIPEVGKLVRFQGDLTHLVTRVTPGVEGERVSLVCEQYALPDDELACIPEFGLESQGKRY